MRRKRFIPRYRTGAQFITPDYSEAEAIENSAMQRSAVAGGIAGTAADFFLPGASKILSPLLTGIFSKFGEGKREKEIEEARKHAEGVANRSNASTAIVSDPTEIQANVFKKGTIRIKPENKGKFTASAKKAGHGVQEHARKVLADPNATPLQKKRANFARNAAKWKKEDGANHMEGTKDIEAEKDELIFRKVNNRWKLIADLNGEKAHIDGGVDVTVQEGDVIFPGTKRKDMISLLDSSGFVNKLKEPSFETARMKLPADTNDKGEAVLGLNTSAIDFGNIFKTTNSMAGKKGFNFNKFKEGAGKFATGLGTVAPTLFNLSKGMQKPEEVQRRYVDFKKPRFVDTSQQRRNDAKEQFLTDRAYIAGKTGGNAGALLSNVGAASNRLQRNLGAIDAENVQRAQAVENVKADISNQESQINTQLGIGFDEKDAMNRAMKDRYLGESFSQISDLSQQSVLDANLRKRDEAMMRNEDLKLAIAGMSPHYKTQTENIAKYRETGDSKYLENLFEFRGGSSEFLSPKTPVNEFKASVDEMDPNSDRYNYPGYSKGTRRVLPSVSSPFRRRFK